MALAYFSSCAVGIASKYDVFAMLPATSIANALAALTAQNLGAGEQKSAPDGFSNTVFLLPWDAPHIFCLGPGGASDNDWPFFQRT